MQHAGVFSAPRRVEQSFRADSDGAAAGGATLAEDGDAEAPLHALDMPEIPGDLNASLDMM